MYSLQRASLTIQRAADPLLTSLLLLHSKTFNLTGRFAEARTIRLDSIGWARYGSNPDWAERAK